MTIDSYLGFPDVWLHRKGLNQLASPLSLVHRTQYQVRFFGFAFHLASFLYFFRQAITADVATLASKTGYVFVNDGRS